MRLAAVTVAAGLALAAVAFAGVAAPEPAQSAAADTFKGITVTGVGTVTAVPDRAELSFGVVSQARTASAALSANAAEMRRVVAALRNAGVAADDIQTQQVAVHPRSSPEGEEIVGYTASNTVAARIRELARAGAVIDAAVGAGANQVFGPSLTRSDQNELYRTALRSAVANARAKAQTLATAVGVTLGSVTSVVEAASSAPIPLAAESARAADQAAPIEPGTQELQATVTVTFSVI
jgi:uncharacterized protein